jgi:plastocyanin
MMTRCAWCCLAALWLLSGCGSSAPESSDIPALPVPLQQAGSSIAGYQVIDVSDGGSIGGTITVSGAIPALPRRQINKDPSVCGAGNRASQQLEVSPQGGLRNVVMIVEGVKRGKALPEGQSAQIDQKNCEYSPHVQVLPLNTELAIANSDPVLHNYHLYRNDETLFNVAQAVQGQVNRHILDQPGFIYAECDVHGWMQAHVAVVENPYYAVTDENGKFSIADLPAGSYTVRIWHEYLGEQTRNVTVSANTETALNLDLRELLDQKSRPAAITSAPAPGTAPAGAQAPSTPASSGSPTEVTVEMHSEGGSFRFEPMNITVKVGSTVQWVNVSDNRHTATDDPMHEKATGQAILPAGVDPWSSPFLPNGQSFSRVFTVPGKYQYFCRNHEQFGMIGTVTVVP